MSTGQWTGIATHPSRAPSRQRSHDGVKAPGGGGAREGAVTSQSTALSRSRVGRAEPGAARRAPGWGRGGSAVKRELARPSPSPATAGPEAMEPDNSPRKIQFTVPLLEPHLDPEAAEQVLAGRGSRSPRRTRYGVVGPKSLSPTSYLLGGMHLLCLWGSPSPPPTVEPGLLSAGPCAGRLPERCSLLAQFWGHDPSPAGDVTAPHTQSTLTDYGLGGGAKGYHPEKAQ